MNRLRYLFMILLLAALSLSFTNSGDNFKSKVIKDFSLKNIDNKKVSLSGYKNAKGFMVIFTCNKCPMAKFYSERLNKLNNKYKSKGVY